MITITDKDIPKVSGGLLPEGVLMVEGVEMEVVYSANQKRMIKIQFRVEEPEGATGRVGFNNFVLGSDTDLEANTEVETWKNFGPSLYKEQLHAANYAGLGSINYADHKTQEDLCAQYAGTKFLVECYNTKQKGGDYDGTEQNNFRYHKIGTRAVGLKADGVKTVKTAPMAPVAPVAAPVPVTPPVPSVPATPAATAEANIHCDMCEKRGEGTQDYGAEAYKVHLNECIQKNIAAQGAA